MKIIVFAVACLPVCRFLGECGLSDGLPDSLGALGALRKLWVTQNALRGLPAALAGLTALEALLAGNNLFSEVPPVVCALTTLQQLHLSLNPQLQRLPAGIGALARLEWLDLSECQLEAVPPELGVCLTALRRLDLHSNHLGELPPTLSNLVHLDHLSLHRWVGVGSLGEGWVGRWGGAEMRIPYVLCFALLCFAELQAPIALSPPLPPCGSNEMTLLCPEVGACTALTWLSLNANRLRELPPSIGALTAMQRISLHLNRLERLPPELGNLTQLEALRWGWWGGRGGGERCKAACVTILCSLLLACPITSSLLHPHSSPCLAPVRLVAIVSAAPAQPACQRAHGAAAGAVLRAEQVPAPEPVQQQPQRAAARDRAHDRPAGAVALQQPADRGAARALVPGAAQAAVAGPQPIDQHAATGRAGSPDQSPGTLHGPEPDCRGAA